MNTNKNDDKTVMPVKSSFYVFNEHRMRHANDDERELYAMTSKTLSRTSFCSIADSSALAVVHSVVSGEQ